MCLSAKTNKKIYYSEKITDEFGKNNKWFNNIEKAIGRMSFNRVYYFFNDKIYPVHFKAFSKRKKMYFDFSPLKFNLNIELNLIESNFEVNLNYKWVSVEDLKFKEKFLIAKLWDKKWW